MQHRSKLAPSGAKKTRTGHRRRGWCDKAEHYRPSLTRDSTGYEGMCEAQKAGSMERLSRMARATDRFQELAPRQQVRYLAMLDVVYALVVEGGAGQ